MGYSVEWENNCKATKIRLPMWQPYYNIEQLTW